MANGLRFEAPQELIDGLTAAARRTADGETVDVKEVIREHGYDLSADAEVVSGDAENGIEGCHTVCVGKGEWRVCYTYCRP